MPRSAKSKTAAEAPPVATLPPLPVPVRCCGEGCDSRTTLVLMGDGDGYEGGVFEQPGWMIGTGDDIEDSGGSFICRTCFEKERDAGGVTRD
jgi:hypothetical protein